MHNIYSLRISVAKQHNYNDFNNDSSNVNNSMPVKIQFAVNKIQIDCS